MDDARVTNEGETAAVGEAGPRPVPRERLPVLVVLHQAHSTPGHVGRILLRHGHALDVRRPRYGDPLPETLERHAGAVIFGGPMSANDRDDYVRIETEWIGVALGEGKPFLGVCLGAQMLAVHLGSNVWPDPNGRVEIGYHRIYPSPDARIGGPWPGRVYQWHREGLDLPSGAVALAASDGPFTAQAFRFGNAAYGVQFHPEITYAMVCRWSGRNAHRLELAGAQERACQLSDHIAHGPAVRRWLERFLATWLAAGAL